MGINSGGKRRVFDDAFRREAVRIFATSDRTIRQVAVGLGVGVSSLGKWKDRLMRRPCWPGHTMT
jgi:transposase-like protein